MFHTSNRIVVVLAVLVAGMASTVEAAKGVKKNNSTNGQHFVTGVVTSMTADGNGGGSFQLRMANQHKKTAVANANGLQGNQTAAANSAVLGNTFTATPATQFHNSAGAVLTGAAMHIGAHVRVQLTGNQAQSIQILSGNRAMGNFIRHRANTYLPHIQHSHPVHHHRVR